MKKTALLFGMACIGLGSLPLGCASAVGTEDVGIQQEAVTACYSNYGMWPTKAALAVAVATELGRWDASDLEQVAPGSTYPSNSTNVVRLKSSAVCVKNSCKNTKALLGLQDVRLASVVDQHVFNPWNFNGDLVQSFQRESDLLKDIATNRPNEAPPPHKLKLVGGPVNLGVGACGPHYIFQADRLDGTPLSSAEASHLINALCFYGVGNCGPADGTNYIDYQVTTTACPSGRTCIAIDPTDGDNSTTTTTTSGASPTYPLNRLYDPYNTKLGTSCTTTAGKAGTMVSKCSTIPTTCGYLYCV